MTEKRRSPRVRAVHLIAYGVRGEEKEYEALEVGRTLDVSETGVRVETMTRLDQGLDLEMDIAVGEELLRLHGRVVNSEAGDDAPFETGIELTEISDEDRARLVERPE